MGTQQKSAALATVFGARSITGMNVLLAAGVDKLKAFTQANIDASGAAKQMAEIMRMSILNKLKALGSALTELSFKFLQGLSKDGKNAIDTLTEAIRGIDVENLIKVFKRDVLPVLESVWFVLKGIGKTIQVIIDGFMIVGKVLERFLDNITFGGLSKILEPLTKGFIKDLESNIVRPIIRPRLDPNVNLEKAFAAATGIQDPLQSLIGGGADEQSPIKSLIGGGADERTPIKNPDAIVQKSISETTRKGELTIRDETGRAEITDGGLGNDIQLLASGAFD